MPSLFDLLAVGDLALPNRIVMAPLTRNRASQPGDVPTMLNAEYYTQRATAGLLIAEATQISPEGKGYAFTPGIHSPAQVAGWRLVTDAVHAAGGRIVLQLWHVGRISHTSLQPGGAAPVAPSALAARTKTFIESGFVATSLPRALETAEIARVVADYAAATTNARAAGFDGVEIHGANGYLIDQFMRSGSNARVDRYGGDVAGRTRFLGEVIDAVVGQWAPGRVGIRLSPFNTGNGAGEDADPAATFGRAIEIASAAGLAYLHMVEGQTGGEGGDAGAIASLRAKFAGVYIANNGYDRTRAVAAVAGGVADAVAFGRPFIANPDLVARLRADAPLAALDQATLYGGDAHGYTDYPALAAAA